MTLTQTLPPGLDLTPDLEAWLRGEIEKQCEQEAIYHRRGSIRILKRVRCRRKARWLLYARRIDGHRPASFQTFLCNRHRKERDWVCGTYGNRFCPNDLVVTWVERIVKRWWQ